VEPPQPEPEDFDAFWRATYDAARRTPLEITRRRLWSPSEDAEVYELAYDSWNGVRIGGWAVRPRTSRGGVVVGHGYGGRSWFDVEGPLKGFTRIYPCLRGFNLSAHKDIPWQSSRHVLHGIQSRESYVLRGCAADLWLAAGALLQMWPDTAANLCYFGGSFGGGMGALAVPWDNRFRAAVLSVPTFGHHPLRLKFKSKGSAEAVRLHAAEHPEVTDVLRYFDAATAARRIAIPVLCAPALFDPTVVPPGQFAVANALNSQSRLFILPAGHFSAYPGAEEKTAEFNALTESWVAG